MSNEQETVEDIVADIRAQNQGLPEDSYALSPLVCDLLSFADRIEAASAKQSVTDCNHLGNAAKMREALETISKCDISKEEDCYTLYRVCEAALSSTPRNCDVLSKDEVLKVLDDCSFSKEDTIKWLYEEAKGDMK